jgi:hypothetical protein
MPKRRDGWGSECYLVVSAVDAARLLGLAERLVGMAL